MVWQWGKLSEEGKSSERSLYMWKCSSWSNLDHISLKKGEYLGLWYKQQPMQVEILAKEETNVAQKR